MPPLLSTPAQFHPAPAQRPLHNTPRPSENTSELSASTCTKMSLGCTATPATATFAGEGGARHQQPLPHLGCRRRRQGRGGRGLFGDRPLRRFRRASPTPRAGGKRLNRGRGGHNETTANVALTAGSLEPLSVCRADDMVKRKECWATTEREGGGCRNVGRYRFGGIRRPSSLPTRARNGAGGSGHSTQRSAKRGEAITRERS